MTKEYTIEKSVENNLTQTSFIKKDADGHVRSGATYQIKDGKNNVIDEWVTTEDPHLIKGLIYGNEYTLIELVAPDGLTIAKDIKFTYTMDTKEIVMLDKKVEASKLDAELNYLEGAKLQVISTKTRQIVDEWITDGKIHTIENLIVGHEYILQEIDPPYGYMKAEDITFTVKDDGKNQLIEMIDKQILTDIQVNKVDSLTKLPIKSQDFEFTMYADQECTVVLDIVHANIEDGTATFNNVPYGVVYIKETKAPLGYRLSTEVKKVIINDDLEGVGNIHSFVYENTLLPVVVTSVPTGDQMNVGLIVCLAMSSALASCFLFYGRKKEEE